MTEFEKSSLPISVIKILQLRESVTEIPTSLQFLPWAAVHGDQIMQENRFSTLPMATNISPLCGFSSKTIQIHFCGNINIGEKDFAAPQP